MFWFAKASIFLPASTGEFLFADVFRSSNISLFVGGVHLCL